jgi:uncharacterized protein (TIGR02594 family)
MASSNSRIIEQYLAATAQFREILDSFTATRAQKAVAERSLSDLAATLGAQSVRAVEGRTALLTGLIVELNEVMASVRVNPIGDMLGRLNGILNTANTLLAAEKEALSAPAPAPGVPVAVAGTALAGAASRSGLTESHIVRVGDSIENMSAHFRMSPAALRSLNPQLKDDDEVKPGAIVQVPQSMPHDPPLNGSAVARSDARWYEIAKREMETSVAETPGPGDNPRIVEFHKSTHLSASLADDDETPWCSSFVNWCVEQAGFQGTNSARAKSWLNWGSALDTPREGCIVVLNRTKDPSKGHVGFFVSEEGSKIQILGGNQNNEINISGYAKSRLAGYRWI